MSSRDYADKLKNPRWQRRRLEKMSAAEWRCEICGDDKEELHVHHMFYDRDMDPWEYSNGELQCLCNTCHTIIHMDKRKVKAHAARLGVTEVIKKIYVRDRLFRIIPKSNPHWAKYAPLREELLAIQSESLLRFRALEASIKEQVNVAQSRHADGLKAHMNIA